ncbi:MAG: ATP-binding protein [Bacillota bacterium]
MSGSFRSGTRRSRFRFGVRCQLVGLVLLILLSLLSAVNMTEPYEAYPGREPETGRGRHELVGAAFTDASARGIRTRARVADTPDLLIMLLVSGVSLAMAHTVGNRLARRLAALQERAAAIAGPYGGPDANPADDAGGDELEEAARALERMAARIEAVEKELLASNRKFRALVESVPLPVVAADAEGNVTLWNRAAERVFGWTEAEVLGRQSPAVPDEEGDEAMALWERVLAGESLSGLIVRRRRRDGSPIDISLSLAPWGDGTQGGLGVFLDITERLRFLQVAAHMLRNPMAGVSGLVSLLERRVAAGQPVGDLVPLLRRDTERLAALLSAILEAFRVQEGQIGPELERVDLTGTVLSALDSLRVAGVAERIRLEGLCCDGPCWIWGDPEPLRDMVRTLVTNALTYSPDDEPVVLSLSCSNGLATLSVADRGAGIPPSELDRVFEPFYRSRELVGSEKGGLGLGLYVCREIVRAHGGRIWVASAEGRGAVFRVELPVCQGEGPGGGAERSERRTGAADEKRITGEEQPTRAKERAEGEDEGADG